MNLKTLSAAAVVLVSAFSAQAAEIFFEDFDEVTSSTNTNFATAADSSNLDQFTVTAGSVDAYTHGGFALPCTSLGCLDLDGSTGGAETRGVVPAIRFLSVSRSGF